MTDVVHDGAFGQLTRVPAVRQQRGWNLAFASLRESTTESATGVRSALIGIRFSAHLTLLY